MAALAPISPVVWQVPRAASRPLQHEGVTLGFTYASFTLSSKWAVYTVSKIPVPITYFRKLKYGHMEEQKWTSLCLALTIRRATHIYFPCVPPNLLIQSPSGHILPTRMLQTVSWSHLRILHHPRQSQEVLRVHNPRQYRAETSWFAWAPWTPKPFPSEWPPLQRLLSLCCFSQWEKQVICAFILWQRFFFFWYIYLTRSKRHFHHSVQKVEKFASIFWSLGISS